LAATRGSGSKVIDRRMGNPPKDRPPGHAADLATMHRLITRGVHSLGVGMRLGSLRAGYPRAYRPSPTTGGGSEGQPRGRRCTKSLCH
jgi:hypothetical protein